MLIFELRRQASYILPPSQPAKVIQNTHVGFCRAVGKAKGQRRPSKLLIYIHFPASAGSPCPHRHTLGHMHSYSWRAWCQQQLHRDISAVGSDRPKHAVIYSEYRYNTHSRTQPVVYMNGQMERWCARDWAFFKILSGHFPSYVCLHIFHACLFVHAQVTAVSAVQPKTLYSDMQGQFAPLPACVTSRSVK